MPRIMGTVEPANRGASVFIVQPSNSIRQLRQVSYAGAIQGIAAHAERCMEALQL